MRLLWMYLTFFLTVAVNFLAEKLPLNGVTTGEVSNLINVWFTPANFVFGIWGLIYSLLFIWLITLSFKHQEIHLPIAANFIASNLLNIIWLIAWHFEQFWFSLFVMIILFGSLFLLYKAVKRSAFGMIFLVPISIYFGWITVALLTNLSYVFVNSHIIDGVQGLWTCLLLIIGTIVAIFFRVRQQDVFYPSVFVWAYIGIFMKLYEQQLSIAILSIAAAIIIFASLFIRRRQASF